jgi:hypothetical protein
MKLWIGTPSIDDREERRLEEEIARLTEGEAPSAGPQQPYWANLPARINRRIDDATSPRALTISWAARVAIPGVLAILSFLVAVQYFVPMRMQTAAPLRSVVLSLPENAVDSLLAHPNRISGDLSLADLDVDPFPIRKEDLAEYLIASGSIPAVTENLDDEQVTDVLTILGSQGAGANTGAR